ncbi:MAG: hypothetical protein WAU42_12490 [Solirubrobacteraceae bacterium]
MQSKLLAIYMNDHLAGATGKLALWCSLDLLVPREPELRREQLAGLIARAERQLEGIEGCRRRAVVDAFTA